MTDEELLAAYAEDLKCPYTLRVVDLIDMHRNLRELVKVLQRRVSELTLEKGRKNA